MFDRINAVVKLTVLNCNMNLFWSTKSSMVSTLHETKIELYKIYNLTPEEGTSYKNWYIT
jgi:hypothetical protein